MIRLTVLYGNPADRDAFVSHYENTHVPLVKTKPHLSRFTWGLGLPGMDGGDPPYFLNAELCFDSAEDMAGAFGSEEGQATAGDMVNLVCDGVTMMVSEGR
ncbi:EthD family reductase [Acidiferrimicrobium sp. IK]|uniref:EthD family reductase n=1 Tax=Acidiferrimicrobium sp. IK TaxID=2871700 RepID=UPI0021CAE997|nr:EthD family reductase [Acidiferrimicrobium sp. IK]MCU4185969.1 EthD family reductase [Acidiferrimicrobium sp. IK]